MATNFFSKLNGYTTRNILQAVYLKNDFQITDFRKSLHLKTNIECT